MISPYRKKNELSIFIVRPCLDKRERRVVSQEWIDYRGMFIVSNDAVLVHLRDYKIVHFKSNGEVIHQKNDITEDLKDSEAYCESEMINNTKFVAYKNNKLIGVL